MAIFPTGLPKPLQEAYSLSLKSQVIESDMEVGPSLARRTSNVRSYIIAIQMLVTQTQLETFQNWFDSSAGCAGGASRFTGMNIDVGGGLLAGSTVECRIVGGVYEVSQFSKSDKWLLKFTVETC